jgi:hypothetical protein
VTWVESIGGPGSREFVNGFLRKFHYLGPVAGWTDVGALRPDRGSREVLGLVVLGTPSSIVLMRRGLLEIRRVAVVPGATADADVLQLLAYAKGWATAHGYRSVVGYADPAAGAGCPCDRDGGRLYLEAGFRFAGHTKPHPEGWGGYRPSGKAGPTTSKLRFLWEHGQARLA